MVYWDSFDCEIQSDELASTLHLEDMYYEEEIENQNED